MKTYRFIGTELNCSVAVPPLVRKFGGTVQIPDDYLPEALRCGAQVIPEDMFQSIGFTEDELKKFPSIPLHHRAPAEFLAKRTAAWKALHDYRESILNPQAAEPAPDTIQEVN